MNTEKSAIEKMVEWCKAITVPSEWVKDNQYRQGYRVAILQVTAKLNTLTAEEKSAPDKCQQLCAELRHICDHLSVRNEYGALVVCEVDIKGLLAKYESKGGK